MKGLLFVFGRTPDLSFFELCALSPASKRIHERVAYLPGESSPEKARQWIARLGGTVKIGELLDEGKLPDPETLSSVVSGSAGYDAFGLSWYGDDAHYPRDLVRKCKEILAGEGRHVRYLLPHDGSVLSSVAIAKQHALDFLLIPSDAGVVFGRTLEVQPFEAWSARDYGRPSADPKSGMLPPKVARMIVNIALGPNPQGKTLLDPFCGMGTILTEAYSLGADVWGGDTSDQAVSASEQNLAYIAGRTGAVRRPWHLFRIDATHISERIPPRSIDAVVTEPYMGPTSFGGRTGAPVENDAGRIKNIVKGLEKLYIGCLRDWQTVVKSGGTVLIALPEYVLGAHTISVKKVIDKCEMLGYTVVTGPIEYSRPQAVVRRKFYIVRRH
ncbi:hypothetical protein M1555_02490 [Patescibacteria group bacterium]|nr:hypothetical protein [Patescibacteria group bacterium]